MKTYDEIKDIIVNKLGLKDMESYKKYLADYNNKDHTKRRLVTQADVDLLSPDNVDCHDFWEVVDEIFGLDPVCFGQAAITEANIDACNQQNLSLARMMGMLNFVDEWRHFNIPFVDIGCGYGMIKNYCQLNTAFNYIGFDAVKRTSGANLVTPEGAFPQEFLEKFKEKIYIVYSSNTFQHLSNKQRSRYFKDVSSILDNQGIFVFNCLVHSEDPHNVTPERRDAEDGRRYLRHYGQFTEIPYSPELINELSNYFELLYVTRRGTDNFTTFTLKKKAPTVVG